MLFDDDLDLAKQYYWLRGQQIYYRHVLDNYRHYGVLAPVLDKFASLCDGFVHDLGNGLNAIRGRLEWLSVDLTDPEHARSVAHAKALCELCGWRIYALQEVSPSMPIYAEPLNLPEFIPLLLDTLSAWQPPSVRLKFHTGKPRLIVADYAFSLRLAFLELLINGIQTRPDGGRIDISLQRLDNGLAQIEIVDSGPGLPRGDPEQYFDLNFTTSPRRYGLGLYVARKVIEMHRGTLTLQSEPGQGTRAIIQLPIGNPEPDWDHESELVLALENMHDAITDQKQDIETYEATYDLPREQILPQLSDLFGQLSQSVVQFVETGLTNIRHLLAPLSGQLTGEAMNDIQFILEKCDYCDILLGNARAIDPNLSLEFTLVDLNQIARQVVGLMTLRTQPSTELHLNLAASLPSIKADASLIATALLNLVHNALDAAGPNGRVEVHTLGTNDAVAIRLTNTGKTIPLDRHGHIFDLDYTTHRKREFGLGLYVAHSILIKHNGIIAIRDVEQLQTTIEFALPVYEEGDQNDGYI